MIIYIIIKKIDDKIYEKNIDNIYNNKTIIINFLKKIL